MEVTAAPITQRPQLTVAILTKNEAHHIEACVRSASFADQIVVVDSGSTDGTVELAKSLGAQTFSYTDWQGFAVQRNRLLMHTSGDYVFFLDADEVITDGLRADIQAAVASNERAVWKVRWRTVAYGQELTYYREQSSLERLFRRDMIKEYVGVVHEHAVLVDEAAQQRHPRHVLRSRLLHYSRETVRGSLVKLTQYAMLGASKRATAGKAGGVVRGLASGIASFLRLYVLRLGFLCGGPGFLFCFFIALESFFRYAALHYDRAYLTSDVGR